MDRRRTTLAAVFLVGVCAVLSGVLWQVRGAGPASPRPPLDAAPTALARIVAGTVAPAPVEPPGVALLRAWDVRRAAAWARGDPTALAALYTPGSRTGRADQAMLTAYAARGVVVRDLREQVLETHVVKRTSNRLILRVVDRLSTATAVGHGLREALPRGTASTHLVDLVRIGRRWRVSEVRAG